MVCEGEVDKFGAIHVHGSGITCQDSPKLSAHAAETRHLIKVLVQICSDLNKGTERDSLRLQCGLAFVEPQYIMYTSDMC